MSNASPVKEPSMDEILASIRRIIESGDERPNFAAFAGKPRDRETASAAATARSSAGDEGERKNIARLVTEATARQQKPSSGPEPVPALVPTIAGTPVAVVSSWKDAATVHIAEGDAPGSDEGAAPQASGDETSPSEAADVHPAFRSRPDWSRTDTPASHPVPQPAESVEPAAADAGDDGSSATDSPGQDGDHDGDVRADGFFQDGATPGVRWATAAGSFEPPAQAELQDFGLDFDEEDFAEELRSEVRLADLEADLALDAVTSGPRQDLLPPAAMEPEPEPVAAPAAVSALISEQAGEQVAAAFDDLARAIREGQMKSMEEMAREMLRPMLQEWLDDNLPRLVERLVRDEIERVARGGRR